MNAKDASKRGDIPSALINEIHAGSGRWAFSKRLTKQYTSMKEVLHVQDLDREARFRYQSRKSWMNKIFRLKLGWGHKGTINGCLGSETLAFSLHVHSAVLPKSDPVQVNTRANTSTFVAFRQRLKEAGDWLLIWGTCVPPVCGKNEWVSRYILMGKGLLT